MKPSGFDRVGIKGEVEITERSARDLVAKGYSHAETIALGSPLQKTVGVPVHLDPRLVVATRDVSLDPMNGDPERAVNLQRMATARLVVNLFAKMN